MKVSITVDAARLRAFGSQVLRGAGVPQDKADWVAQCLVAANLRGVDSHGIHLLDSYVAHLLAGNFDPLTEGHIVRESGACLLYDGENGLGHWTSKLCCAHAVRLAGVHGLGMVSVRQSAHFGIAATWGRLIAEAGMLGIAMTNASPSVPPWQGREGRVGTNPICVAVPSAGKGFWLLDMATTTVALGKIMRAAANHEAEIPAGWALDEEGRPTTVTSQARFTTPLGGYKGSGLNVMVEILCGVLSGGAMHTGLGSSHSPEKPMLTSHMFLAIDVARFLPRDEFQQRMEDLVEALKSSAPAAGYEEVLVAGEPESRIEAERTRTGIPIDEGTWGQLERLAETFAAPLPRRRD